MDKIKLTEGWVHVIGYEENYCISKDGNIRSLDRFVSNPLHGKNFIKGKPMRQYIDGHGYYALTLQKDGKSKKIRLHRLIAMHFIENPENKKFVNHKNGIKTDNRIENLEWVTPAENNIHSYKTGLRKAAIGKRYTGQYKSIVCYDSNGNELAIFKSCAIAAKLMKMDRCRINMSIRGEIDSYNGLIFKYASDANRN